MNTATGAFISSSLGGGGKKAECPDHSGQQSEAQDAECHRVTCNRGLEADDEYGTRQAPPVRPFWPRLTQDATESVSFADLRNLRTSAQKSAYITQGATL